MCDLFHCTDVLQVPAFVCTFVFVTCASTLPSAGRWYSLPTERPSRKSVIPFHAGPGCRRGKCSQPLYILLYAVAFLVSEMVTHGSHAIHVEKYWQQFRSINIYLFACIFGMTKTIRTASGVSRFLRQLVLCFPVYSLLASNFHCGWLPLLVEDVVHALLWDESSCGRSKGLYSSLVFPFASSTTIKNRTHQRVHHKFIPIVRVFELRKKHTRLLKSLCFSSLLNEGLFKLRSSNPPEISYRRSNYKLFTICSLRLI